MIEANSAIKENGLMRGASPKGPLGPTFSFIHWVTALDLYCFPVTTKDLDFCVFCGYAAGHAARMFAPWSNAWAEICRSVVRIR
jgi:hypothetical protein